MSWKVSEAKVGLGETKLVMSPLTGHAISRQPLLAPIWKLQKSIAYRVSVRRQGNDILVLETERIKLSSCSIEISYW